MSKWSQREDDVMKFLGLTPQPGSGNGPYKKEDGESEELIAQLKSTEGKSISVKFEDVKSLLYHAKVSHKTPIFVLDFMEQNEMLIAIRPRDIKKVAKAMNLKK